MKADRPSTQLFLVLSIPHDFMPEDADPDVLADEIVRLINRQRQASASSKAMLDGTYDIETGAPRVAPFLVGGIPAAQWLTPTTLAKLRHAAGDR